MNKKLYEQSGYLNFNYILQMSEKHNTPYIFIVGGRGIGKTYGCLKYCYENNIKIMFMRRTQAQLDLIRKKELSPYKAINADFDLNINFFPISKYNSELYNSEFDEKGHLCPIGDKIGLSAALSTIANVRGFDANEIDIVVYDEFIPEKHEKALKYESDALFNALETIARNRELQGEKPLKLIALANSNNLANEIFLSLDLVNKAERMQSSGQEIYYDHNRGIMLLMLDASPISMLKSKTSLYTLTRDTDFAKMAISNNFTGTAAENVKSQDLKEYKPFIILGELAIYRHKSKQLFYVTPYVSGVFPEKFTSSILGTREFRYRYRLLILDYYCGKFLFETSLQQILFEKYIRR